MIRFVADKPTGRWEALVGSQLIEFNAKTIDSALRKAKKYAKSPTMGRNRNGRITMLQEMEEGMSPEEVDEEFIGPWEKSIKESKAEIEIALKTNLFIEVSKKRAEAVIRMHEESLNRLSAISLLLQEFSRHVTATMEFREKGGLWPYHTTEEER
jgi:hypothetical protein